MSNVKDLPISKFDQRLLACAALVRAADEHYFNMGIWKCGTTHCAVGLYAEAKIGELTLEGVPVCKYNNLKLMGWSAVEHEFNLKNGSAFYLFSPEHYRRFPSPRAVAERIEKFVANRMKNYTVQPVGTEHV